MASGGQREVVGPRLVVTYVVVVPEGNSHACTSQLMLPFCSGGGVRVLGVDYTDASITGPLINVIHYFMHQFVYRMLPSSSMLCTKHFPLTFLALLPLLRHQLIQ